MQRLQQNRGKIIDNFAFIEYRIEELICRACRPGDPAKFTAQVLQDEYFSFALKKNILKKILESEPSLYGLSKKEIDGLIGKLTQLAKRRNVIAHAVVLGSLSASNDSITRVYYLHGGVEYDPEKLSEEYNALSIPIMTTLVLLIEGTNP